MVQPYHRQMLVQAADFAKNGQRDPARQLIYQVLNDDPNYAMAWWGLARVTMSLEERRQALTHVLYLNPYHAGALHMMQQLDTQQRKQAAVAIPVLTSTPPCVSNRISEAPTSLRNIPYAPPWEPTVDECQPTTSIRPSFVPLLVALIVLAGILFIGGVAFW
ncbi:MAG TPA: hypothetical protein VHP83_08510 [Aggregatilineaceae bacterium]|nr:hypothetical protein [Aggregatilineaceae bacterium]